MKKSEIIFSTIKLPLDFILIVSSFFVAREVRLITDLIPTVNLPVQTLDTLSLTYYSFFWASLYILLFIGHGLYSSKISNSKIKEFLDIILYGLYWFIFYSVIVFYTKWFLIFEGNEIPRLIILFSFIISTLFIILERLILNNIQYILINKWYIAKKNIALITHEKHSKLQDIMNDISGTNIYHVLWYFNKDKSKQKNNTLNYLWDNSNFKSLAQNWKIDEILYINSTFEEEQLYEIWDIAKIFGVRYRYITNSFDVTNSHTSLSFINKIPVIEITSNALGVWWRVTKRAFDILISILWLIFLSPVIVLISILIKIEDPQAPIIYKNKRIWQDGKAFILYKFRYLKWKHCIKESYWVKEKDDSAIAYEKQLIQKNSSRKWPVYKIKDDPRKTKVWSFIERYSLDEIPQFVNVVIWNMSIVWPRPHQPREVKLYKLWEKRVLTIKPWITGMWQVNGREKNSFEDEAKMDIFYIENWTLLFDLKIMLKTFWIIFNRK